MYLFLQRLIWYVFMNIKIKKGLDLTITGTPEQVFHDVKTPASVALIGEDYPGLKARMLVKEGERVKKGQPLFMDKHIQINYTAPAAGTVKEINLGKRRALESVVVELNGNETVTFQSYTRERINSLSKDEVKENLRASGLWPAFRTRPYGKTPDPDSLPHSIFVTAMDTQPLAADPAVIINAYVEDFIDGLNIIANIADIPVFVCQGTKEIPLANHDRIKPVEFTGPHPAGLVGTHIHYLDPSSAGKTVWYINYQDVIAIGKLFTSGHLWQQRIIALAGPGVIKPRLVRTFPGADIHSLTEKELVSGDHRLISGSVLSGREAKKPLAFLGRFHHQISVIQEGGEKTLSGWWLRKRSVDVDTSMNGRSRAIIPLDHFEQVMPLDILPTPLLKSLIVEDLESAEALGCLELEEEDLALCTYVCCGKQEYGQALRNCLSKIEQGIQ